MDVIILKSEIHKIHVRREFIAVKKRQGTRWLSHK